MCVGQERKRRPEEVASPLGHDQVCGTFRFKGRPIVACPRVTAAFSSVFVPCRNHCFCRRLFDLERLSFDSRTSCWPLEIRPAATGSFSPPGSWAPKTSCNNKTHSA
ncbi:unnamed protein product [Nezara viridula]|uniref:Uncharacterized protein n=1 Tax=Nezara viridula TaxID=85310 RepID=A0A9P0HEK7_NEZVI|nr:unnamed protein product [Nezara viridula]